MLYPLGKRVLIEQPVPSETTAGGVVLPDVALRPEGRGTIMEVGSDCVILKKGDRVIFSKYVGSKVKLEGDLARDMEFDKHIIVDEDDVLAVER